MDSPLLNQTFLWKEVLKYSSCYGQSNFYKFKSKWDILKLYLGYCLTKNAYLNMFLKGFRFVLKITVISIFVTTEIMFYLLFKRKTCYWLNDWNCIIKVIDNIHNNKWQYLVRFRYTLTADLLGVVFYGITMAYAWSCSLQTYLFYPVSFVVKPFQLMI